MQQRLTMTYQANVFSTVLDDALLHCGKCSAIISRLLTTFSNTSKEYEEIHNTVPNS